MSNLTAAKRDANEEQIVSALRAVGCLVHIMMNGKGFPDLFVWSPFLDEFVALEVKDGNRVASQRRLTPDQVAWHEKWSLAKKRIHVVETLAEAFKACGIPLSRARTKVKVK